MGGGVYAQTEISMNSVFDPLYTVGGGVCTGFAEAMAIYSRFYVKSATFSVQILSATTSSADLLFMNAVRSDEAAAGVIPTLDIITEGLGSTSTLALSGAIPGHLEGKFYPASFQGLSKQNKDELSGSLTVDPVIQPAVYCGVYSATGATGHSLTGLIIVSYDVELYRPNTLNGA